MHMPKGVFLNSKVSKLDMYQKKILIKNMKQNGFMSFIERYVPTRSYLKKFAVMSAAIFFADYVLITKVIVPRYMEIEDRWYYGLSLEEQEEFLKKSKTERYRILDEVDRQENAKSRWFGIF
jgi:hypothetical protein